MYIDMHKRVHIAEMVMKQIQYASLYLQYICEITCTGATSLKG
jgi:hypothetical protein